MTKHGKTDTIAAIVPAYNEGVRIAPVLKTLTATGMLDEIIVIDDGSSDNTADVVRKFKKIRFMRNHKNRGKSYSMQRGVDSTKANIIFFCDADLKGLTPNIVENIIRPVLNRKYDMFIGIRNNVMQKSVHLFALNSGERAMRREVWERLPEQFKKRYRVEAGLNYTAKKFGRGTGYKVFNYYQTLKEAKYGFFRGTFLRWWMNLDVGVAYMLVILNRAYNFCMKMLGLKE